MIDRARAQSLATVLVLVIAIKRDRMEQYIFRELKGYLITYIDTCFQSDYEHEYEYESRRNGRAR
jgi:hypothetical protein